MASATHCESTHMVGEFDHVGLLRPKRQKTHRPATVIVADGEEIVHAPLTTEDLFPEATVDRSASNDDSGSNREEPRMMLGGVGAFALPGMTSERPKVTLRHSDNSKSGESSSKGDKSSKYSSHASTVEKEISVARASLKPVSSFGSASQEPATEESADSSNDDGRNGSTDGQSDGFVPKGLVANNPFVRAEREKKERLKEKQANAKAAAAAKPGQNQTDTKKTIKEDDEMEEEERERKSESARPLPTLDFTPPKVVAINPDESSESLSSGGSSVTPSPKMPMRHISVETPPMVAIFTIWNRRSVSQNSLEYQYSSTPKEYRRASRDPEVSEYLNLTTSATDDTLKPNSNFTGKLSSEEGESSEDVPTKTSGADSTKCKMKEGDGKACGVVGGGGVDDSTKPPENEKDESDSVTKSSSRISKTSSHSRSSTAPSSHKSSKSKTPIYKKYNEAKVSRKSSKSSDIAVAPAVKPSYPVPTASTQREYTEQEIGNTKDTSNPETTRHLRKAPQAPVNRSHGGITVPLRRRQKHSRSPPNVAEPTDYANVDVDGGNHPDSQPQSTEHYGKKHRGIETRLTHLGEKDKDETEPAGNTKASKGVPESRPSSRAGHRLSESAQGAERHESPKRRNFGGVVRGWFGRIFTKQSKKTSENVEDPSTPRGRRGTDGRRNSVTHHGNTPKERPSRPKRTFKTFMHQKNSYQSVVWDDDSDAERDKEGRAQSNRRSLSLADLVARSPEEPSGQPINDAG